MIFVKHRLVDEFLDVLSDAIEWLYWQIHRDDQPSLEIVAIAAQHPVVKRALQREYPYTYGDNLAYAIAWFTEENYKRFDLLSGDKLAKQWNEVSHYKPSTIEQMEAKLIRLDQIVMIDILGG